MPSSWSRARTERTVCLVAQCLVFLRVRRVCECVWNILSVFFFRVVSSKLFQVLREHCPCVSHMSNLAPSVPCKGLRCTRVSSSLFGQKFRRRCHWSAEFQAESRWLAAVSCIPPSTKLLTCDSVYIGRKVPCFTGKPRFFYRHLPLPHFLI